MKIGFTGAQSTGKSTLLYELRNYKDFNIVTEVVRNLFKKYNINVNEMGDDESQILIFNKNLEILLTNLNFISDRSIIDVFSYTLYSYKNGNVGTDVRDYQYTLLKKYVQTYDYIFYFPIEFPLIADGFRSTDEIFRCKIEENIQEILENTGVDYYTVKGNISDRIKIFKNTLGDN